MLPPPQYFFNLSANFNVFASEINYKKDLIVCVLQRPVFKYLQAYKPVMLEYIELI
jgi:hypothetical protein